jgi:tetratricopeptide (TPR) repeat protein
MTLRAVAVILALVAAAQDAEASDYFRAGAAALSLGKFEEAIALLEAYADHEAPHPDASYNRGAAYVLRVRSGAGRHGDLGCAAAAFEEALLLRPSDGEARHALELVRAEVARRRMRKSTSVEVATPSIDRVLVGLCAPRSWAIGAIMASWLFAVGLLLRRRRGSAHLAGTLLTPIAAVLFACLLPIAWWSERLDRTTRPAVLVTKEAQLMDENGNALGGDPITEATHLELGAIRGNLVHVRYGTREGWLPREAARVLRTR